MLLRNLLDLLVMWMFVQKHLTKVSKMVVDLDFLLSLRMFFNSHRLHISRRLFIHKVTISLKLAFLAFLRDNFIPWLIVIFIHCNVREVLVFLLELFDCPLALLQWINERLLFCILGSRELLDQSRAVEVLLEVKDWSLFYYSCCRRTGEGRLVPDLFMAACMAIV